MAKPKKYVVKNLEKALADEMKRVFEDNGATVKLDKQPDGLYTLTASYP